MRLLITLLLFGCATAQPPHGAGSDPVEAVFAKVHSSVVTVRTASRAIDLSGENSGMTSVAGIGSGVLISEGGQILTAAHVVHTADAVFVEFASGDIRRARVVASDRLSDIALIELTGSIPKGTHIAELGDSDAVGVGREIFVVGAPRGMTHSLTVGHISARRRPAKGPRTLFDTELFQTDAAINEGNSGGPMFDMSGEVIGIVSHIVSVSGGHEGLGFAVTTNVAKEALLSGPVFWSGIEVVLVNGHLARILNLPPGQSGLLVQHVAHHSPCEALGLRGGKFAAYIDDDTLVLGGDIILAVQGVEIDAEGSYAKVRKAIDATPDGGKLQVTVLRAGQQVVLDATVAR